jgi:ABC-type methionine transport system permease subunit
MNYFDLYFCILGLFVGMLFGFCAGMVLLIRRQNVRNKDLIYSTVIDTTIASKRVDDLEPNLKWSD